MKYSLIPKRDVSIPQTHDGSWQEFTQKLGPHDYDYAPNAKDLGLIPLFSAADFRNRSKALSNVEWVYFGILDFDELSLDQFELVFTLAQKYQSILYTTWTHPKSQEIWKVRLCVNFSRPVHVREWAIVWDKLNKLFGGFADTQSKDPSRFYFIPAGVRGDERKHFYGVFEGEILNVDYLKKRQDDPQFLEKITRDRLKILGLKWSRSSEETRNLLGKCLIKISKGESFAEPGERDTRIYQLTADLAKAFPLGEPQSIADLFAQSLQLMAQEARDCPTVEIVKDKFARAKERLKKERDEKELADWQESALRIKQAFSKISPQRDWPYTELEIDRMQQELSCEKSELSKLWILQKGSAFWVLGPDSNYQGPFTKDEIQNAVLTVLAPAESANVQLYVPGKGGTKRRKSIAELVESYGLVVDNALVDLGAQKSRYVPGIKTFIEATCPLRPLEPCHDRDVEEWLKLLCGEYYNDVCTWLALCTKLEETCAALLFTGHKGVGKGLFAHGVSRLWTLGGPTMFTSALADFNDALSRCPLTFADEQLPKTFSGQGRTAEIREFISAQSRPLKRKHLPEAQMIGACRLIIAANNEDILNLNEHLSTNDLRAIEERFYHVKVDPLAESYLQKVEHHSFVSGDRIAKHALWLRDNYPVEKKGRFWIKRNDQTFYHSLSTKSGLRSAVCQWLVGYLRNPLKIDALGESYFKIQGGLLLVRSEGILKHWSVYVENEISPALGRLTQTVGELSHEQRVYCTGKNGKTVNYRSIEIDHLIAWAGNTEMMSESEIREVLSVSTEERLQKRNVKTLAN